MDAMVGLLAGVRAQGAFALRAVLDPPWSMRIEDRAPIAVFAVLRGRAWVQPHGGAALRLGAGDVVIARGPDPYRVCDDPASPDDIVIHPDQRCTTVGGQDVSMSMSLGVRTWGNSAAGATVMVVGTYSSDTTVGRRVLTALPPIAVLPADPADPSGRGLVELLAAELAADGPGQAAVVDRVIDLLLVVSLRRWFADHADAAPRWWQAEADPLIGPALRSIYDDPARAWTIAELGASVGASRAAFAKRFSEVVGEPPMAFVTSWRLALAADLLRDSELTIGAIAAQIGYSSPFALSTAFKRRHGISPRRHREVERART